MNYIEFNSNTSTRNNQNDQSIGSVSNQYVNVQGMDSDLKALVAMRERKARRRENEDEEVKISSNLARYVQYNVLTVERISF